MLTMNPPQVGAVFGDAKFTQVWDEAQALVERNFDEMNQFDRRVFKLHLPIYTELERMDRLRLHTVRILGKLVGYRSLILVDHEHTGDPSASCDAFYMSPECRGTLGVRLQRWSDAKLASQGVMWIYQASQLGEKSIDRLLIAAGYEPIETKFCRYVGQGV